MAVTTPIKFFLSFMLACTPLALATEALAAAGQLDSTFGNRGIFVANNAGITNTMATALAIDTKRRIVVAGQVPLPPNGSSQPAVLRLNSNGTLDTSFGNHGVANINFREGGGEIATCMVLQPDGKIVIGVAFGQADAVPSLALVRFDEDGAIDSSFGNSGVALLLRGAADTTYLARQPDGKLLAGGGMVMARATADGAPDSTFGENGIAPLVAPASSIVLQSDGKILAISGPLGNVGPTPPIDLFAGGFTVDSTIVRYSENGALDTSFGTLGRSASIVGISAALLQSNGDIVAVGTIVSKSFIALSPQLVPVLTPETTFAVARYHSNGGVDDTFNGEGAVLTSFGSFPFALPTSAVMQSNGSIIAAGDADFDGPTPSESFAIARYTSAGVLDTTFGSGGKVLTPFTSSSSTNNAGIAAVALDAEGRLVAVGNVSQPGSSSTFPQTSIVVARYLTQ